MAVNIQHYFNLWKKFVSNNSSFHRYNEWCEINNERLQEEEFAANNNMDSVHWCFNCRCYECNVH